VIGPPSYLNRMTKNGGLKDDKGDFPPLETQGVKSMLRRSYISSRLAGWQLVWDWLAYMQACRYDHLDTCTFAQMPECLTAQQFAQRPMHDSGLMTGCTDLHSTGIVSVKDDE
jgi:hypothetical protein